MDYCRMDYNTIILKFRNNCLIFITARLWKHSLQWQTYNRLNVTENTIILSERRDKCALRKQ